MEDVDGCDVTTKDFYQYMFRTPGAVPNFRDSAEALHLATCQWKMRKRGLGLDVGPLGQNRACWCLMDSEVSS
jgi:hypothetical protein